MCTLGGYSLDHVDNYTYDLLCSRISGFTVSNAERDQATQQTTAFLDQLHMHHHCGLSGG